MLTSAVPRRCTNSGSKQPLELRQANQSILCWFSGDCKNRLESRAILSEGLALDGKVGRRRGPCFFETAASARLER
jgi:hypothetical protein